MTRLYLRVLDRLYRWAWVHVPMFADYAVEFVHQVERRIHGKLLQPDYIQQMRDALKDDKISAPPSSIEDASL